MCILLQHPRAKAVFDAAANLDIHNTASIRQFLVEAAQLVADVEPQTEASILRAYRANCAEREALRQLGIPIGNLPAPRLRH